MSATAKDQPMDSRLDQHAADLDVILSVLRLATDDVAPALTGAGVHGLNGLAAVEALLLQACRTFEELNGDLRRGNAA